MHHPFPTFPSHIPETHVGLLDAHADAHSHSRSASQSTCTGFEPPQSLYHLQPTPYLDAGIYPPRIRESKGLSFPLRALDLFESKAKAKDKGKRPSTANSAANTSIFHEHAALTQAGLWASTERQRTSFHAALTLDAALNPPRLRESKGHSFSLRALDLLESKTKAKVRSKRPTSADASLNTQTVLFDEHALPTQAQLRAAAALPVIAASGVRIPFGDLWADSQTIIFFIRHFW